MSSVASLVPSTPDMPADFSPQTSSAHSSRNAASSLRAPDGFSLLLRNHHVRIEIEYWIKEKNTKILCERSKECIERRTRSAEFKCSSWKWSGKGKFVEREITLGAGRRMDECFWRIEKERVVKRHSLNSWSFPRLIRSFKLVPFHRSCCTGIEASCVRNYRNKYRTEFELEGITLTK